MNEGVHTPTHVIALTAGGGDNGCILQGEQSLEQRRYQ